VDWWNEGEWSDLVPERLMQTCGGAGGPPCNDPETLRQARIAKQMAQQPAVAAQRRANRQFHESADATDAALHGSSRMGFSMASREQSRNSHGRGGHQSQERRQGRAGRGDTGARVGRSGGIYGGGKKNYTRKGKKRNKKQRGAGLDKNKKCNDPNFPICNLDKASPNSGWCEDPDGTRDPGMGWYSSNCLGDDPRTPSPRGGPHARPAGGRTVTAMRAQEAIEGRDRGELREILDKAEDLISRAQGGQTSPNRKVRNTVKKLDAAMDNLNEADGGDIFEKVVEFLEASLDYWTMCTEFPETKTCVNFGVDEIEEKTAKINEQLTQYRALMY